MSRVLSKELPNIAAYARDSHSFGDEYFRIFPNMRRVSFRALGGYGEGFLCCVGCTLGMVHTPSTLIFQLCQHIHVSAYT